LALQPATYLLAPVVLTLMTFWMREQGRSLRGGLQAQAQAAVGRGSRLSMALVAFQAVGREGLEAVVFLLAIVLSAPPAQVVAGALAGVAAAVAVARLVYGAGVRLDMRRFFAWTGALLLLVAAGLLADAVEDLQALGWLTLWRHPLWSTAHLLSEASLVGDLLHTFFGYAARPTALQLAAYLVYLAVTVLFLRSPRRLGREATSPRRAEGS